MWVARSSARPTGRVIGLIGDGGVVNFAQTCRSQFRVSVAAAATSRARVGVPQTFGIRWQSSSSNNNDTAATPQFKGTLQRKKSRKPEDRPERPKSAAPLTKEQSEMLAAAAERQTETSRLQATWWDAERPAHLHLRSVAAETAARDDKTVESLARKYYELVNEESVLVTPEQHERARIAQEQEARRQIISGEALILRRGSAEQKPATYGLEVAPTDDEAQVALKNWLKKEKPEVVKMPAGPEQQTVIEAVRMADDLLKQCRDYLQRVEEVGSLVLSKEKREDVAKQVLATLSLYDKIVDELESRVRSVIMNATHIVSHTEFVGTEDARQLLKRVILMQELFETVSDRNELLEQFPVGDDLKSKLAYGGLKVTAFYPKGGKRVIGPKEVFFFFTGFFILVCILVVYA